MSLYIYPSPNPFKRSHSVVSNRPTHQQPIDPSHSYLPNGNRPQAPVHIASKEKDKSPPVDKRSHRQTSKTPSYSVLKRPNRSQSTHATPSQGLVEPTAPSRSKPRRESGSLIDNRNTSQSKQSSAVVQLMIAKSQYVVLGKGTFATITLGWHLTRKSPCAIKTNLCPRIGRLEARALRACKHPNIVPLVAEWNEHDDHGKVVHRLALPYYPTNILRPIVAGYYRDLRNFYRLTLGITSAVKQMHQSGWLHLDIKPDNILLHPSGKPVLADLGMAHEGTEPFIAQNMKRGSGIYRAPESRLSAYYSQESDLFQMGVTFMVCITVSILYQSTPSEQLTRNMGDSIRNNTFAKQYTISPEQFHITTRLEKSIAYRFARAVAKLLNLKPRNRGTLDEFKAQIEHSWSQNDRAPTSETYSPSVGKTTSDRRPVPCDPTTQQKG